MREATNSARAARPLYRVKRFSNYLQSTPAGDRRRVFSGFIFVTCVTWEGAKWTCPQTAL